ncbi:MAG: helix-turn-helix transcriptional regulator [bacterium]|nr:helix-turn-helix transcriptional regulator [bacterium]
MAKENKFNLKVLGQRIKRIRLDNNMTQNDMAEILELQRTSITHIERGKYGPSLKSLVILRDRFDITIDWLLTGEKVKPLKQSDDEDNALEILMYYIKHFPQFRSHIMADFTNQWKPRLDEEIFSENPVPLLKDRSKE